jgi:hypothetical protein
VEDQITCGQGLAEHAALPALLAELTDSVAENLELHLKALDLQDDHSRKEHDAYVELAKQYREIADRLRTTADQMAGYRDLPMGRHNETVLAEPQVLEAFEHLVKTEEALLALLEKRVRQERRLLSEFGPAHWRSGEHSHQVALEPIALPGRWLV